MIPFHNFALQLSAFLSRNENRYVILSEARSAESKDLRIFQLHGSIQVRGSLDSVSLRSG